MKPERKEFVETLTAPRPNSFNGSSGSLLLSSLSVNFSQPTNKVWSIEFVLPFIFTPNVSVEKLQQNLFFFLPKRSPNYWSSLLESFHFFNFFFLINRGSSELLARNLPCIQNQLSIFSLKEYTSVPKRVWTRGTREPTPLYYH